MPNNIGTPASAFKTDKYGFTASGAALNEIALALKGQSVIAHQIDFSDPLIKKIQYYKNEPLPSGSWVTTNYLDLYGWCFEKESGTEAIILNLGPNRYGFEEFDKVGYYNCGPVSFQSMVQLTSADQTAGNGGVALLNTLPTDFDDPLFTTTETIIANPISSTAKLLLEPYS
ncbi:MAG: hypothetical protein IPO63_07695 [Bacteroidetes bacterium]|nr:hypothetical protein [Bacteroidota bacterium]